MPVRSPACWLTVALIAIPTVLRAQDEAPRIRADEIRTIRVIGMAEEAMTPDAAELSVGVESQSATASASLAANSKEMRALMEVLRKFEIAPDDVQTSQLTLTPVYDTPQSEKGPGKPTGKLLGYKVSNTVDIKLRETKRIGELVDDVVKAGVNQIKGLEFTLKNTKELLRRLRKRAIEDAREKADEAAKDAQMVLGDPVSINIEDVGADRSDSLAASRSNMITADVPTPISLGQETLRVAVEVIYEIKPRR